MKVVLLSVFIGCAPVTPIHAEEFNKEAGVQEAKKITKQFAGQLKKELQAAMQAGGPTNALQVCNLKAMPITEQISNDSDALVSRVSLKNRNPDNVPNDWQREELEAFDKRAAQGENIDTMASVSVKKLDNGKHQIRFMKALPTGGVCLACHGQQVAEPVLTKIKELYPDDKATGYSLGEVRGAIVVLKNYDM